MAQNNKFQKYELTILSATLLFEFLRLDKYKLEVGKEY